MACMPVKGHQGDRRGEVAQESLLSETGVPLARSSRAKIRNIMSALYSHAIRWEWTEKNPITSVRQSAKRQKAPDVLTPEEIMAFLKECRIHSVR